MSRQQSRQALKLLKGNHRRTEYSGRNIPWGQRKHLCHSFKHFEEALLALMKRICVLLAGTQVFFYTAPPVSHTNAIQAPAEISRATLQRKEEIRL
jgi:hypothetical protein